MKKPDDFTIAANSDFIEVLYQKYNNNPMDVANDWRQFFESLEKSNVIATDNFKSASTLTASSQLGQKIIDSYRARGHLLADLDPLQLTKILTKHDASLSMQDLGIENANTMLQANFHNQSAWQALDLTLALEEVYCKKIAIEASFIPDLKEQEFLYQQFEALHFNTQFTSDEKKYFLNSLLEIENFEHTIHIKFPGAKRFSCEGSEGSILAIKWLIDVAARSSINDIVVGMAHRGRLATISCVMNKPYEAIFVKFAGHYAHDDSYSSDVKYHIGFKNSYNTYFGANVNVELLSNPSHLEAVNSVVAGYVKAKQDDTSDKSQVLGILIHGDASFAGQGVVSESLALSKIDAYSTKGIIHIVINNQIGFTADASDTKQGLYATEVAKSIAAPIIHVNGQEVESICASIIMALEYRNKYNKDIVIDIVGYRKYGHNESDEPIYTQPLMYAKIHQKTSIANLYKAKLVESNVISLQEANSMTSVIIQNFEKSFASCKDYVEIAPDNKSIVQNESLKPLDISKLKEFAATIYSFPSDFNINNKLEKLFASKKIEIIDNEMVDWGAAEKLAFASLLVSNIKVRLSGQDCARGTFSHRQSVIFDQTSAIQYISLNNLASQQAKYIVTDSNLSEYAALGFEYGYALWAKNALVMWEAQFGDFANGAQIIIDQFISAAEQKWKQQNGIVLLLPHGYEGQGPEHSSARIERFLQMAAQDNMRIYLPSSPASYFHLLRLQAARAPKKPMIIFTPKSLLRHKLAVDPLSKLSDSSKFEPIINDDLPRGDVSKIILCSGKIYYDLYEARMKNQINNIAIIRIEQLYPLDFELLTNIISSYPKVLEVIWCQEEPLNMGAYSYMLPWLLEIQKTLRLAIKNFGREASASPASGYLDVHNMQQDLIIKQALNIGE